MSQFSIPDRKAPRYRPKRLNVFSRKYFSDFYKKYPGLKKYSSTDIRNIIKAFNYSLLEEACKTRDGVEFPENLGFVFLATTTISTKEYNVDYGKSIKYDKMILHNNHNTDGRVARILYTVRPAKYKILNSEIWSLKPSRKFKMLAKKYYVGNYMMYHDVRGIMPSHLFKNMRVS